MVLAEEKCGNAGGQDSVGVWSAHAWPLWDVIVEWSRGAGSRLNSLQHCPDGLEFTPVGDQKDRVQESQFKAGGLAGMALQWGQGHMEEERGSGNTLKGQQGARTTPSVQGGLPDVGGHIQVGEWGWNPCIGRRRRVPVTGVAWHCWGSMGQRRGCGGAPHIHTSESKGNLSPEATFLGSPAIALEVLNPFQAMMGSFVKQEQWAELPRQLINFVSQLPKPFTDFYFPPPETLREAPECWLARWPGFQNPSNGL